MDLSDPHTRAVIHFYAYHLFDEPAERDALWKNLNTLGLELTYVVSEVVAQSLLDQFEKYMNIPGSENDPA